jgi:hypothetical protein
MHLPARVATAVLMPALLACLGASGCMRPEQTERQQRILKEQEAILRYSDKVPEADELQSEFSEEWRKANEIKELKAFKDAMSARVIPALERYVTGLKMMPAETPDLGQVHGLIVQAYGQGVTAFKAFVDGLDDDNVEERYKTLLQAMDEVAAAEKRYLNELSRYYARNRVRLAEPPESEAKPEPAAKPEPEPAAKPAAAAEAKPEPAAAAEPPPAPDPKPAADSAPDPAAAAEPKPAAEPEPAPAPAAEPKPAPAEPAPAP